MPSPSHWGNFLFFSRFWWCFCRRSPRASTSLTCSSGASRRIRNTASLGDRGSWLSNRVPRKGASGGRGVEPVPKAHLETQNALLPRGENPPPRPVTRTSSLAPPPAGRSAVGNSERGGSHELRGVAGSAECQASRVVDRINIRWFAAKGQGPAKGQALFWRGSERLEGLKAGFSGEVMLSP